MKYRSFTLFVSAFTLGCLVSLKRGRSIELGDKLEEYSDELLPDSEALEKI